MKVILISRVANLGNIGDVVTVKDGYGKNFLIPQKKAIFYNAVNYKSFEEKKQQFEAQNQKSTGAAEINKQKLNGKNIIIIGNASDDGRLYGSVTTSTVAAKVNEILNDAKAVSRIDVILKKPIKDIGVFDVKIDLYSGIIADIKVVVGRSESEVETLLAADAGKNKKAEKAQEVVESASEIAVEASA